MHLPSLLFIFFACLLGYAAAVGVRGSFFATVSGCSNITKLAGYGCNCKLKGQSCSSGSNSFCTCLTGEIPERGTCKCRCRNSGEAPINGRCRPFSPGAIKAIPIVVPTGTTTTNSGSCAPTATAPISGFDTVNDFTNTPAAGAVFSWNDPRTWPIAVNPSAPSTPAGISLANIDTSNAAIQSYILRKHDVLRAIPSATDMRKTVWNSEAAAKAQAWANTCPNGHDTYDQRKISTCLCGQNIAYIGPNEPMDWNSAINLWYNEVKDFTYGSSTNDLGKVGHYTQLVWAQSFQIGCGAAFCPNGIPGNAALKYVYVCNYCPAGNVNGIGTPYTSGTACAACGGAVSSTCYKNKLCLY